jgi:hypothetical protein
LKWLIIPELYTVIAFGTAIYLWFYPTVSTIPFMNGLPLLSVPPIFVAEFLLMASIILVWSTAGAVLLAGLRRRKAEIGKSLVSNCLTVFLVSATFLVAVLGCISYAQPLPIDETRPLVLVVDMPSIDSSVNNVSYVHAVGVLLCEAAWILKLVWRIVSRISLFKDEDIVLDAEPAALLKR